ncbi:MAG: hypothetical protein M1828_005563 [Chrysothrix sp. TS-e1954]|nr:MAG: hypothetical protein M1828_005563 [Chrysothrix sp. TS-e1954]
MATKTANMSNGIQAKPSPVRTPPTSIKPARSKGPANGNILSFFKKTASRSEISDGNDESLFLQDESASIISDPVVAVEGQQTAIRDPSLAEALKESTNYQHNDNLSRFNESSNPVKRRKMSWPSRENDLGLLAARDVVDDNSKRLEPSNSYPRKEQEGLEPLTALVEAKQELEQTQKEKAGPFIDGSDSEDESPPMVQTNVPADAPTTSSDVSGKEEEAGKERLHQDQNGKTPGKTVVSNLKREATSCIEGDGFADFEGMEDFDDEYEEGEEFVERRWQQNQSTLEEDEGVDYDENEDATEMVDIKAEPPDHNDFSEPDAAAAIPSCPMCNSSLAGISEQDASIHVNACIDGNPTPLPSTAVVQVKNEPSVGDNGRIEEPSPGPRLRRPLRPAKPGQGSPFVLQPAKGSSAFSHLMSGHAEDAAWATAAAAEHSARGKPAYQRTCPFYKILPGFFTCVDAFRYGAVQGCNAYFLSHFHSDHYVGLTSSWTHGPIYCSRPTANLVRQQLRVDPRYVVDLQFEKRVEVPGTQGVFVTMIPANHCPGSSLYLFEKTTSNPSSRSPKTQRVLHCGDFRACPAHIEHPLLKPEVCNAITGKTENQKIDVCYLDTTYLSPKYAFPSQEDVIQACGDMCISLNKSHTDKADGYEKMKQDRAGGAMNKFVQREDQSTGPDEKIPTDSKKRGALLVIVGTYSIGKERICLGIARALNTLIFAPPSKRRICAALEDSELNRRLTDDPRAAQVHMTPLFEIKAETLADYLQAYQDRFSRCVGFRPSGWNYRPPAGRFVESPSIQAVLHSESWKSVFTMRDLMPARGSTSKAACYGVPYSEHSSFRELTMFCCGLNIDKVIPTVNVGSAKSRERMKVWCDRWATDRKKNGIFRISKDVDDGEGGGKWYPGEGTWQLRTNL